MNALEYFNSFVRNGRAPIGERWLIRINRQLILCQDADYPAIRFVRDDETLSMGDIFPR